MTAQKSKIEKNYQDLLETIKRYPDQVKQAWDEVSKISFPHEYRHIDKVAVCGMGGSALEGRVVDSLMANRIRVPVEIFNQYHIPNYSDTKTLIISYSYSGNTEEAVSCLNEAIVRDCKIFGATTDGKMKDILEDHKLPHYLIDPEHNPSNQPRNAVGYSIGAILALFSKLEIAHILQTEIEEVVEYMRTIAGELDETVPEKENLAKRYAKKLEGKAAILVASEHLYGTVYTFKNQLNESAKTFSTIFELPELNHHLMEGLERPEELKKYMHFILYNSDLYYDRVQKRYPLTAEVIEKNGYEHSIYKPRADKKIKQVFETLVFNTFVGYYLSKNYGIDPNAIPWVDYFKEKLAKI